LRAINSRSPLPILPSMHTLRLLGSVSIDDESGPISGPSTQRHRLALLALLAAAHPAGVARDKLLACLWPERGTERARNLLNQAVHALRKTLGEPAIVSVADELRLDASVVHADTVEFTEALSAGDLARVVALHRGPFLDGFFLGDSVEFERWAAAERTRFRNAYRGALEGLAHAAAASGDRRAALDWWRRLAAEDPLSEHVTIELMKALEAAGERAEAIRQARVHSLLLEEEVGAGPDPAVAALAERMRTAPESAPVPAPTGTGYVAVGARVARQSASDQMPAAGRESDAVPVPRPVPNATPPSRPARRYWKHAAGLAAAVVLAVTGWAMLQGSQPQPSAIRRIAVLPLANLTGDPARDYFVAGMHDALVTELGRIPDLTVISRQSVIRYRDSDEPLPVIARALGVDAVVEGSVFLAGDSVRVTAQLIRAWPEQPVWTDMYHGALSHALALQREVARAIAVAIRATVTPALEARLANTRAVDPGAQREYHVGLHHLERYWLGTLPREQGLEALRTGIAHLERAVALDPGWAAAHARLARAYHSRASGPFDLRDEFYAKSKAAALKAIALDDAEAQAHASLGFVLFTHEWDWAGAENELRRALELDPNSHHAVYAVFLQMAGRYEEAVAYFRLAEERNPLSRTLKRQVVAALFCARFYDEALEQSAQTFRLWPELGVAAESGFRANVYTARSMHAEAIREYEQAVALSDSAAWAVAGLAYVYARAGADDRAGALLRRLEEQPGSYHPMVHAALGQTDQAVAMIEAALEERGLVALTDQRCFPEFDTLRHEPRLRELLGRMRLAT
jgi:DNA-binding SARP family transcriptional activator/TolB-like protein